MDQVEGNSHPTIPRLRGVEVTYVDGRPVETMELVIRVDEQEPTKRKSIANTGTIACNILCPMSSTLTISIRKTRKMPLRTQGVHVEARVETVLASLDTPLQDEGKTVNVKLFFSGILGTDAEEDATRKRDAAAARATAKARPTILGKLEKVRFLINIIEPTGSAVSELHHGIKGAFVAVQLLIKVCERQEACQKAAAALTDEWDDFLSLTESAPVLRERQESRKAVECLLELIDEVSDYIINYTPTGVTGGLLSRKYNKKIEDFKKYLAEATRSLDLRINVEELKGINNLENNQILDALKPALNAHYNPEVQCLKNTRTRLLGKTSRWVRPAQKPPPSAARTRPSAAQPRVFWLCGMGGSGKSYVANSVAAVVNADTDLDLSCFFCKRDDPDLSKPANFFRTLAYRIAQYHASYRSALVALLCSPEGAAITTSGPRTHYKMLFEDLLPKMQAPARSHVVVIDALDECGSPADQGQLAECILSLAKAVPWIKIFVTSRPVEVIGKCFSSDSMCITANINNEDDTGADIRRFIESELEHLEAEEGIESASAFSSDEIDRLVLLAAGLFIWASTLFKYVRMRGNPEHELRTFLSDAASKEPLKQLYALYDQIVDSAVSAGQEDEVDVLHAILGMVFVTSGNRPLSAKALSCFLCVDERYKSENRTSVRKRTRPLHAVLYEDARGAVRVYHPSFLDFLEDKLKEWFSLGIEDIHRLLYKGCLATMHAELKFNICQLEDSTLLNKDVPDLSDRISKSISEALHYGSLFWFSHLLSSGLKHDEGTKSSVFALLCSPKFMFWLEVLSLLGAVGRGAAILRGCVQFFEGSPDIADVVSDLEKFVLASSEAMESTPHIYVSALAWAPEETLTQKMIAAQFKNVHWITRKEANWEATRWVKSVGEPVNVVACSPDGCFVAAAIYDGTMCILNSSTGEPVGEPLWCGEWTKFVSFSPDGQRITVVSEETVATWNIKTDATFSDPLKLEGPNLDKITAAAVSPNSSLIACCSRDNNAGTIEFWDAQTGAAVGEPLTGHEGWIDTIAFSPDGQRVVSGSRDETIRMWDVKTGMAVGNPLELGCEGSANSISFSPDGRRFVSGSDGGTVRIWNAQTGVELLEPLQGHSRSVISVAFSRDGRWVASGSADWTIRVWDSMTGMAVGAPFQGHSGSIHSLSFSPDDRHIVSGSEDGTVRMWGNIGFGAAAKDASEGHSFFVTSISFSPDGEHIVSGSADRTVRIWSTKTGAAVGRGLEGLEGQVTSVCFSPDGLLVASALDDESIRLWDAVTGAAVGEPLVGHTGQVLSIAFSPDGRHMVSGSLDETICIWDVKTGTVVGNSLEGHEDSVNSVCYSFDGQYIASGSSDNTVRIWNAQTGAALLEPLRGHSEGVTSVAFSPDGRWVASGSFDSTIRIWDTNTGASLGDPVDCHSDVRSVAFSPDSQRVACGSNDGRIHICDVQEHAEISESFQGHFNTIYAVAFSPDGRHLASGSEDQTVRIWDARSAPVDHEGGTLTGARWDACCAQMDIEDGWVKDGEKLLLWIPYRYRENFICRRLQVCIRRGVPWPEKPEMDLEQLIAYMGSGWTRFYLE